MAMYAGLLSLAGLSLFLSWALRRSASLMPLLAVGCAVVFFSGAGMAGLLRPAGYVWYVLCGALGLWAVLGGGKKTLRLVTPGFVLFVAASAVLIAFYLVSKPMLTQWDEFTFWGTAAKATGQSGQLYTTAPSNLIAKAYPPGLIAFGAMMQFFVPGGFSEPAFIASFAVFNLACLTAGVTVWDKKPTAAILLFAAFFTVPFLFSVNTPAGQMQWAFQACMADVPMALLFGGTLCFYFTGGQAGARLMVPFGILLAALTSVKDMGLALALLALFVAGVDMIFCQRKKTGFFRLKGGWAIAASLVWGLVLIAAAYGAWALHMDATTGEDRFNLGSGGEKLGQVTMLLTGVKMLFGIGRSEQFSAVLPMMGRALFSRPVSLLGSGMVVLAVVAVITALAFLLAATKSRRRQIVLFTAAMALGFAAFYVFNIFTYALIFQPNEALVLKDYARYISPYWTGWLMAALALLCRAAQSPKATFYRLRVAQGASCLVAALLVLATMLAGNWQANFLRVPPTYYEARHSVRQVVEDALQEGMQPKDVVYILSQGDDGSRFYLFGYEMQATRALVFNGYLTDKSGALILDEAGNSQLVGNTAATLVDPAAPCPQGLYPMACTPEQLTTFLRQQGCTHLLIDVLDSYVVEAFGPLFADSLLGWDTDDIYAQGHRYYAIRWDDKGRCSLIPAHLAREGGDAL